MGACVSPDGSRLYVSNGRGGTVSVIDAREARVLDTIAAVGARPWGIAVSSDGATLYTANGPSHDVSVIEVASARVVARIAAGSSPWGVVIGPPVASSAQLAAPAATDAANAQEDGQWTMAAKDYANTRFSRLREIDASNVAGLQPVWTFSTDLKKGHEAAPLVIGATMYVTTPYPNRLYALDLTRRGAVRWVYEPEPVPAAQGVACCDVVNRGAVYDADRLFFNTLDAHTVAVDAATGRELWKTRLGDINKGETMTMAPLVVKGLVLVGNSGGEYGVRGWLTALHADTGAIAWRAYSTGPDADVLIGPSFKPYYAQDRGPDLGVSTWPPGRWQMGGGTVWGFVSYDAELDQIYYGTANPGPWNPEQRPGDNKWTAGIFARRPATGEALWFYQWSPHDLYDHDGVNESIVLDLTIEGRARKVLLHAERNGYIYVLDRTTGQVLSADPFVHITSSKGVDLKSGRLIHVHAKAPRLGETVRGICPAAPGAKDWQPAAYSHDTGLLYLPHNNLCQDMESMEANYIAGTPYVGAVVKMYEGPGGKRGRFTAWDPLARKKVWAIEEEFPVWSGALATAGDLVFYGTMEGWFKAVHARTGKVLWKHKTSSGIVGQPVTYRGPDGKQYVAVFSGVGGWAGQVVTGKLDTRDQSAAIGFAHAMRDLPEHTSAGGTLHVFALP
jgi:lanthanide-dependent methanol dehydrogenase